MHAVPVLQRLHTLALLRLTPPPRAYELQALQALQHLLRRRLVRHAQRIDHALLLLEQFAVRQTRRPRSPDLADLVLQRRVQRLHLLVHLVHQLLVVAQVLQRVLRLARRSKVQRAASEPEALAGLRVPKAETRVLRRVPAKAEACVARSTRGTRRRVRSTESKGSSSSSSSRGIRSTKASSTRGTRCCARIAKAKARRRLGRIICIRISSKRE